MTCRYPECDSCYFHNRAPEVCENCWNGSEYEPAELDIDEYDEKREQQVIRLKVAA